MNCKSNQFWCGEEIPCLSGISNEKKEKMKKYEKKKNEKRGIQVENP